MSWDFRTSAFKGLVLPHLENPNDWIPHGIGKLSKVISNDMLGNEVRIHIWDPDIVIIGEEDGGIHNHDHDYESFTIAGQVTDQSWFVYPTEDPDKGWDLWEHRTSEGTVRRGYAAASGGMKVRYQPGYIRTAPGSSWHLIIPEEVAITLVRRTRREGKSFAIAKKGKKVQDGLVNRICSSEIESTLEAAQKLLTR